ncbi:MAG: TIGR03086 family metal-binding protein [Lapillicoccus sp.]
MTSPPGNQGDAMTQTSRTEATSSGAPATAGSGAGGAPDPRPLFARALDQLGRLVASVRVDDLDRPTPCTDYTVRQLLGHLVAVERRVAHISRGGQPFDVTSLVTDVPDDDWLEVWTTARGELDTAMSQAGVLERTFVHPAGTFPGRQAIFAYVGEAAVHGWDLAAAIGRQDLLDDSLAAVSLGPLTQFLPAEPRGGHIPFGPVVDVPADAPAYDRLVGWVGRDPHWTTGTT